MAIRDAANVRIEPPSIPHRFAFFGETVAMLEHIALQAAQAKHRLWIETYILRHDRLGRALAETLAAAARRGLDVRLLYDPLGCNETSPTFLDGLRARGISTRPYRPRKVVLRERHWWPRDHSRMMVIDGWAYTGGAAWGDEWLPADRGGAGWHDVGCAVHGPIVRDCARLFLQRWLEASGDLGRPTDYLSVATRAGVDLVASTPGRESVLLDRLVACIRAATHRVWIENAYFFPPAELIRELYRAADRGLDVKLILPHPTDLPILMRAARAEHLDWLAAGIEIYQYRPSILHAKFAVFDDAWTTIGTFNANVVSLMYSNEVGLFIRDRAFASQAAAQFVVDLAECRDVTRDLALRRPPAERVRDQFARLALVLLETGRLARGL